MFAFAGRSEHNLDDKGRLTIPQRLRDGFAEGYFLTHGLETCLWLLPARLYHQLTAQLSQSSIIDANTRRFEQLFFGDAVEGKLDAQGRLTITPELREALGVPETSQLVVVGARNRIEIWEREAWQRHHARLREDKTAIAEPLRGVL